MGGEFYLNRHNEHLIDQYLANVNKSILVDFTKEDSDTLLISFSGRGRVAVKPPTFELFRTTNEMGVNRILIRDLNKAWFHKGLVNISGVDCFDDMVAYLEEIIPANRFKKIIVIGLSLGGYSALLFGLLTKLKVTVHAFGPQTFLDKEGRVYEESIRWLLPFLDEVPGNVPPNYMDLIRIFRERGEKNTQPENELHIHYGHPDKVYAERLNGLDGVHLYDYNIHMHNLLVFFRERGELTQLLNHLFFTPESDWNLDSYREPRDLTVQL
ncbi:hypothetical protein [Paenibacillus glufosinatiresistens]|uniref:hypothetical protein n=1 Tax=Paenibacillus glufosinatiresistens TaxID=3070657 RepID=UPI00286E6CAF|nr:hypothetical protein [Paenibacillus sp. YX.27]